MELQGKYDSMYLHMKLFGYITTIPLWSKNGSVVNEGFSRRMSGGKCDLSMANRPASPIDSFSTKMPASYTSSPRTGTTNELSVNKIRIHYFFTHDEMIGSLFRDTKIGIRLTTGPAWNANIVASSNTFVLKGLHEQLLKTAQKTESISALFHEASPDLFGYLRVCDMYRYGVDGCWSD